MAAVYLSLTALLDKDKDDENNEVNAISVYPYTYMRPLTP